MQDVESIESELRLVAAVRRTIRDAGGPLPSSRAFDALLDELAALAAAEGVGRPAARLRP